MHGLLVRTAAHVHMGRVLLISNICQFTIIAEGLQSSLPTPPCASENTHTQPVHICRLRKTFSTSIKKRKERYTDSATMRQK